ncbi:hypothetical protein [Fusobacterium sp. PH5-44]|uniref:hypothetical protein n=1 Tax=unclassified Fusobacterium TaxID=2648384 RepID=UPI003D230777
MSAEERKNEIVTTEPEIHEKDYKYEKELKRKFDFFILFTTTITFIISYFSFFPIIMGIFTPLEHMAIYVTAAIIFIAIWNIYFYKDKNYKLIYTIPWYILIVIFHWIFTKIVNWQLYNYIYNNISPNKILIFSSSLIFGIISSIIYQLLKIKSYKKYFKM